MYCISLLFFIDWFGKVSDTATIKQRDLDDIEKKPYRNSVLSKKLCQGSEASARRPMQLERNMGAQES